MVLPLIDKLDSFELVRNQIAGILVAELIDQQALAPGAGEDPLDWKLDIRLERDDPVEKWLNAGAVDDETVTPVVSVWMESSVLNKQSTTVPGARQVYDVTYNLDVFARGVASGDGAGYLPADKDSHLRCHAAVRLVRNILSAPHYSRLLVPTVVRAHPLFENLDLGSAAPEGTESDISVWSCRCRYRVPMTEFSVETPALETLDLIAIDVSDHGGVILSSEFS